MAAASLPENWACINGDHDAEFDQFEVQEIDGALLTSLLEESHGEDCDDERLTSVIRSLQAEIEPNMMDDGRDLSTELGWGCNSVDFQPFDASHVDDLDCSMAHDLEFDWMEVEMVPPSSPKNNWYMDPCGDDELDGIIEFGGVTDFSNMYYGVPLEELSYGSLWQETHN